MEHKTNEFNLLSDAEFNCLVQKVKREIKQVLIDAKGYSMTVTAVFHELDKKYPEWFVEYCCKSLLADKQIAIYVCYHALESDWDADLAQYSNGKKLETNNFGLGDK